jgi:hypothetical protein
MKKNIYTTVFIFISCVLFLFFAVGLFKNPYGPQRLIFFQGMMDFFADFFNELYYAADRDPYFNLRHGDGTITYFPLTYLILYPFSQLDNFNTMTLQEEWNSRIGLMSVFLYTGFNVFLLLTALNQIAKKYLVSPLILISLVLSYIFFVSIERGNIVILSAACIGFFICYYDSKNKYKRILAVISLALAATLKVYPVLFGFLYFEKKQYREILLSAIITLVLVFLPFLFLKRGFANIPKLLANQGFTSIPQLVSNMGSKSVPQLVSNMGSTSVPPLVSDMSSTSIQEQITHNDLIAAPKLPKIVTLFYPSSIHFTWSYPRFRVAHLALIVLSQFKFSEISEYNSMIVLSLSNIAQFITYFLCFVSIVFSCLIKNKWMKISLLTMALIFLPMDSGLYCGLYIFPMIIIFFATLQERSTILNIFTIIVFLVFLNPYQILINGSLISFLTSWNYVFINIAFIIFWFVLLVISGREIVTYYRNRKAIHA